MRNVLIALFLLLPVLAFGQSPVTEAKLENLDMAGFCRVVTSAPSSSCTAKTCNIVLSGNEAQVYTCQSSTWAKADTLDQGTAFPSSPAAGDLFVVTDDSAAGACDSAAGSAITLCRYSGSAWGAVGDGGGSGDVTDVFDCASGDCSTVVVENGESLSATGTGAITATAVAANSVALTTDTTGNYAAGDAEAGNATGVACTDCVALTTETSGNYMADVSAGTAIDVTHTPAEGSTATVDWDSTEVSTTTWGAAASSNWTFDTGTTDSLLTVDPGGHRWNFDNSGQAELVYVGDYDGDGSLEMNDDIQALIDVVCPSSTCAEAVRMIVTPGDYAYQSGGTNGVIELPNDFSLECMPGAILNGPGNVASGGADDLAVVYSSKNNVQLRGCELDGGYADSYDGTTSGTAPRMGVYFTGNTRAWIVDNYIHNTHHAGIYFRHGTGTHVYGNTLDLVGNYPNLGGNPYAGIYVFSNGATTAEFEVTNNIVKRSVVGISLRTEAATDLIENGTLNGNTFIDATTTCVAVRRVQSVTINNTVCENTGPFEFVQGASYGDKDVSSDVTVDGLLITNGQTNQGLRVYEYHTRPTIKNVTITNSADDCVEFRSPIRGGTFESWTLSECATHGLDFAAGNSGAVPDEQLTFRDILIDTVDSDPTDASSYNGVNFGATTHRGLTFEGLTVRGPTRYGINGQAVFIGTKWSDVTLDGRRRLFQGGTTVGSLGTCDSTTAGHWYEITDATGVSDCSTGASSTNTLCYCNGSAWTQLDGLEGNQRYAALFTGASSVNNHFSDWTISHWEGCTGGENSCTAYQATNGIEIQNNDNIDDNIFNGLNVITETGSTTNGTVADIQVGLDTNNNDGWLVTNANCELGGNTQCVILAGTESMVFGSLTTKDEANNNATFELIQATDASGNGFNINYGTATPTNCSQGSTFHDLDGDGTTDCSGGECTLFLCTAANTWSAIR